MSPQNDIPGSREELWAQRSHFLKNLLNASPDRIYFKDRQSRFIGMNHATAMALGIGSPEEAVGRTDAEFFSEDYARQTYEDEQHVMATGEAMVGKEEEEVWPDGHITWASSSKSAMRDDAGNIIGIVGISRDITVSKCGEEALRESEARLNFALETIRAGAWEYDLRSKSEHRTPIHDRIFGYETPVPEWSFEIFLEHVLPEDRPDVDKQYRAAQAAKAGWSFECRIRRADGAVRWIWVVGDYERNPEGEPVRVSGIVMDITERKQTESSLRESEALFRTISEASPLGIILTDPNTATIYANEAQHQICGRTSEELSGTGWRDAIHAEDRERIIREWEEIKRTQKPFRSERRYVHKDGKIVWVSMVAAPIVQKETGKTVVGGYVGMVEDITERRQMQEQILRSQRMDSIGTLAGGIAHDLNNILAPIVMASHLLGGGSEDEQRMVESVQASAKRAADLVKQLLSFARGGEGRRMEMDPTHLIRETEQIAHETFPKNIRITSRVAPNLWRLMADPTQIQQILMNLCLNARDAMPAGGTLTLKACNMEIDDQFASVDLSVKPGHYVVITVEDTGTGIASDIKDRIFDPFFTTKQIGEGTGLGLSTTLGIVKSHGGFIDVKSEPGKGTIFCVHLPARSPTALPQKEEKEAPPAPGQGELVLFVDDEPEVVAMAQRSLKKFGYRVVTAGNGKEAVGQFVRHHDEIAVVVTDMMMPVMDGASMIQELIKIKPDVKIIATTGLAADPQVAAAIKGGATHFLAKPYTPKAMLGVLREVLRAC